MMGKFYSPDNTEAILNHRSVSEIEKAPQGLTNYVYADGIKFKEEATFGVFIRPQDFLLKAFGGFKVVTFWDKENWIKFWKIYNLTQFHNITVESLDAEIKPQDVAPKNEVSNEILSNFDEELHVIVRLLFKENIEFNTEYDFDLIESDIIIASAELGAHSKKIVINPFDEESKQTFINNGYKVYSPDNFKLED
jgi:DEAD/DEAH box helicase domain-containing protein